MIVPRRHDLPLTDLERQNNIKLQDFKQGNVRLYMWRVSASPSCLNVCWGEFSLFVTVQVSISYMLELIYNFHLFIHLRHEETNHDFPLMNTRRVRNILTLLVKTIKFLPILSSFSFCHLFLSSFCLCSLSCLRNFVRLTHSFNVMECVIGRGGTGWGSICCSGYKKQVSIEHGFVHTLKA